MYTILYTIYILPDYSLPMLD